MKPAFRYILPVLALLAATPVRAEDETKLAREILRTAEDLRFITKSQADVDLKTVTPDSNILYDLKVLSSTDQRAYLEFLAPKEERGRKMLAITKQFWSTFPDSKRVVAISKKEMIGNSAFAMADIFQIDQEKDYEPSIAAREKLDGKDVIKLDLKSKHQETPYHRLEYWVEAKGYFPVLCKMYAKSGKHLKSMYVESRKKFGDKERPETTRMEDEVQKGHTSWWPNKKLFEVNVPDNVFTKDYLLRRL